VVASSTSPPPPPPPAENSDSDATYNNNINQYDDHEQEETDSVQTTTTLPSAYQSFPGDHHQAQEQDQDRDGSDDEVVEEEVAWGDEYENEGDAEWVDDHGDNDDDDDDVDDDYDEGEPDPVYVADLFRQSGIDWLQYPEYATHRLVVTSTNTTTTTVEGTVIGTGTGAEADDEGEGEVPARQYYRVMAQFLIPASAIFRDFLLGEDLTDDSDADEKEEEEEEEEEEKEFRRERLSCLQEEPFADASLADDTQFLNPANAPYASPPPPKIDHSLLEPLEPYIYQRYAPCTPLITTTTAITPVTGPGPAEEEDPYSHQPWIHLSLPHPEHFLGLLHVMYDLDLHTWEETCFRPETIIGIIETVRRLECSSVLMVKCLEYFRKVKDILSVEEFEEIGEGEGGGRGGGMEEVRRLYRAAVEGGMLPPDPDLLR
jgi:hypothetical protein